MKMKKTIFKTAAVLSAIMFLLCITGGIALAQSGTLEINYPALGGGNPNATNFALLDYVKYIFRFLISIVGVIGLVILVVAGVRYIMSAGDAGKMGAAKQQILSAFWGIIILLSAYLILITINPQILSPVITELPPPPPPPPSLPSTPVNPFPTADLLGRIKNLAAAVKDVPGVIQNTAHQIATKTNTCDCKRTESICLCTGRMSNDPSACQQRYCYAGADPGHSSPCSDIVAIYSLQKDIVDQRDVILYYKGRVLAEKNDLARDVNQFIQPKIDWAQKQIDANRQVLPQLQGADRQAKETLINFLEQYKASLEKELNYKNQLIQKLQELADAIEPERAPTTTIARLVDQCFSGVNGTPATPTSPAIPAVCQATCQGKCHDYLEGCQPSTCAGGNPCPMDQIRQQARLMGQYPSQINTICDQIISIVNSIAQANP